MRRFAAFAAVYIMAMTSLFAAKDANSAIVTLLNSQNSCEPRTYAAAAQSVLAQARNGKPLHRFLFALVSRDSNFPRDFQISAEERNKFLESSRAIIRSLAEKKDNPLAWYLLSMENNDFAMLKRAAEGGNVQALNAWGTMRLSEAILSKKLSQDEKKLVLKDAFDSFFKAASKGDVNGSYNLGSCYMNGYGTDVNSHEALKCFKNAAGAGHPEAMNNIGGFYRDGIVVKRDLKTAAKWFRASAKCENSYGQLNYALALQRGEGVERDISEAVKYFRLSAEQGNIDAMNVYGMCLYNGDGTTKNPSAAVKWYRLAASKGSPHAMENLAACALHGIGGMEKSIKESTVWKVRAQAARGDGNAVAWLVQNGYSLR
jgi:TPR repeat protein